MHPIRTLKILTRASRLFGLLETGSKDWEGRKAQGAEMSKSLFKSKIFWVQILSAAAELQSVLPLPAGAAALTGQVLTILLRLLSTSQPTHLVSPTS